MTLNDTLQGAIGPALEVNYSLGFLRIQLEAASLVALGEPVNEKTRTLWAVVACVVLSACPSTPTPVDGGGGGLGGGLGGGGGSGGGVDAGPVDAGPSDLELCNARWSPLCDAWANCELSKGPFQLNFKDVSECVSKGSAFCQRLFKSDFSGLILSPAAARTRFAACSAVVAAQPKCDVFQNAIGGANAQQPPDCAALGGTLADGAPCVISDQCQSGFCRGDHGCGTCTSLGDPGASCTLNTDCRIGNACINGSCATYVGADAGCNASSPCLPGLACISAKCQAPREPGQTCANGPNPCKDGFCIGGTCRAVGLDAGPGELCGVNPATNEISACRLNNACLFVNSAFQGLCVGRAKIGDRCFFDTSFQGSQCEIFSDCVNGVCAQYPEASCGRDGGAAPARRDGGILPPNPPSSALQTELAREKGIICDALYACPRVAGLLASLTDSRATCEVTLGDLVSYNISAPTSMLAVASASACADALAQGSPCDVTDMVFGARRFPSICRSVGAVSSGGICAGDFQCLASDHCSGNIFASAPTCGACTPLGTLGAGCLTNADCAAGFSCAQGKCVVGADAGASCSSTTPCDFDLACVAGFCGQPLDAGSSCNQTTLPCAGGLFCNTVTNKCEMTLIAGLNAGDGGLVDGGTGDGGSLGLPCGLRSGNVVNCPSGFNCKVTNPAAYTGYCDLAYGQGEACGWSGGLNGRGACRFPYVCQNGLCQVGDLTYCQ